jgi:hypothetical protein
MKDTRKTGMKFLFFPSDENLTTDSSTHESPILEMFYGCK